MTKKAVLFIFLNLFLVNFLFAKKDSCFVLLALHKNKKLTIRAKMAELSRHGIFFYAGEHVTILFKDKYKVTVSEIIKLTKDTLYISNGYNVNKATDTLHYSITDIEKIYYNGWILNSKRYNFNSYKLPSGCYNSDVATPEDIEKAKNWWKKKE